MSATPSPATPPAVRPADAIEPSASVMLLRDAPPGGDEPLEVLMVTRNPQASAFAGALVFPGGKLDAGDSDSRLAARCDNADSTTGGAGTAPGVDADLHGARPTLAHRIAAIRELFEESGILLARERDAAAAPTLDPARLAALAGQRRRLARNELSLLQLCREQRLTLATDLLVPFARWITPRPRPRRFDAWFFLAPAPAGQVASHDGVEHLDSRWVAPRTALAQADARQLTIIFPTRMNLHKLAGAAGVAGALQAAAASESSLVAVQPDAEPHPQGLIMKIPAAAGYGASRVLVPADGGRFTWLD